MIVEGTRNRVVRWAMAALLIVGSVIGGVGYLAALAGDRASAVRDAADVDDKAMHVRVFAAGSLASPESFSRYRGTVAARRDSRLGFRRGGRVIDVAVDEGDVVRRGDVLARLDTADLDALRQRMQAEVDAASAAYDEAVAGPRRQSVAAAAAEVDRLVAELAQAKSRLERENALRSRGAGSGQTFDDAKYGVDQRTAQLAAARATLDELTEGTREEQIAARRAALEVARAALRQIDVDVRDSQIVAPFDGLVAARQIDEGAGVASDATPLRLIESPPWEARFGLPGDVAASLRLLQTLNVEVADRSHEVTVKRIHPTIDLSTRTRSIDVAFDFGAPVSVGQTVTLLIADVVDDVSPESDVRFWVPTTSLVRSSRGLWSVFVASREDDRADGDPRRKIERRDVRVLRT